MKIRLQSLAVCLLSIAGIVLLGSSDPGTSYHCVDSRHCHRSNRRSPRKRYSHCRKHEHGYCIALKEPTARATTSSPTCI
jgi:hypothetical protein